MAVRFNPSGTAGKYTRTTNLPANNAVTLMAWVFVRTSASGGDLNTVLRIGAAGAGGMLDLCENGGKMAIFDTASPKQGANALPLNTWVHLAMTCDGSTALGYFNGVLDVTVGGPTLPTVASITLGDSYTNDPLTGDICAAFVYGGVLTAAEIQQQMRQFAPIRTANLLAWLPMLATGDGPSDYSGGGDFTATGGTASTAGPPIPWRLARERIVYAPAAAGGTSTLVAGTGTFTLTGQSVGLTAARRLPVANGTYALSGQIVALRRANVLPVAAGSFALTGQTVTLRASRRLAVANGTFTLSGQAVALRASRGMAVANATYALNGQTVRLAFNHRLVLANGVYSLTGEPVTLTKIGATGVTTLTAGVGSYVVTGEAVTLRALRRMAVAAGVFALTGEDMRLAVAHLTDVGTILPSRGLVERRFGAIRTRNRPSSVAVERAPSAPPDDVVGDAWTPADHSGAGLALSVIAEACRVVRTNGIVYAFFAIVIPTTVSAAAAAIGLPIIARDTGVPVAPVAFSYLTIADVTGIVVNGATQFNMYHTDGSSVTNAQLSGKVLRGCAIYEAAS